MMKIALYSSLFTLYSLPLALLGEVTVHKAPLKSLLIENASVVTNVTATPEAAKKLESADGNSWLDSDGVKWAKQKAVEWDGLTAYSDIGDGSTFNFYFESPAWRSMTIYFNAPNSWYAQRSRIEDVEAGDGSGIVQEEVLYDFEGTAPANASTVRLYCTSGRDIPADIRVFDVVREVERFATTGEVAQIASNISSGLTTNDVCAIVTNEAASGWSEWEFRCDEPKIQEALNKNPPTVRYEYDGPYEGARRIYLVDIPAVEGYRWVDLGSGFVNSFETCTEVSIFGYMGGDDTLGVTLTRKFIPGGNVLGLAMAKDVVSASVVTNIVRDNIGTVWDASLGVAWQARMHSGHLYYIAATNQPPEAK